MPLDTVRHIRAGVQGSGDGDPKINSAIRVVQNLSACPPSNDFGPVRNPEVGLAPRAGRPSRTLR